MKIFHSIRWRMQMWHGLLLAVVLAGFGFTAWQYQRATMFSRIDQELDQRIQVVSGSMRPRGNRPPGPPPLNNLLPPRRGEGGRERIEPGPMPPREMTFPPRENAIPPREITLPPRESQLFSDNSESGYYYIAWHRNGSEWSRSPAAPSEVPPPRPTNDSVSTRQRDHWRECFHFLPSGDFLLVGRNIRNELTGIRHFAWLLAGAGAGIFAIGLAGGWWVSNRSLHPIREISNTAVEISGGDLSRRIPTPDTDSELGELASVLNHAFERLQEAVDRQVQFTADASHELRTPISVLIAQTQMALNRERSAEEYRESLEACHRAAQRMRQLIESLLTLARLDSNKSLPNEECSLEKIVEESLELLRPLAEEKGVRLETELLPVKCRGKAEQLVQVVSNLVSNALYYNQPGGRVEVNVSRQSEKAILTVHDSGQGIAPDDLPHIFKRFYRSDKARSNSGRSGLGLAITKSIVESHHGTIHVASELGKGTTFRVELPLLDQSSASATDLPGDSS